MNPRTDAESIFRTAISRVAPEELFRTSLNLRGDILSVSTGFEEAAYDLGGYRHLFIVGMGKASGKMAAVMEAKLGSRIKEGLVVVKDGQEESLARIRVIPAGHPVPDERSAAAARAMLELAARVRALESVGESCLVIVLISGGGSALLCAPMEGLSLAEKAAATSALLASGATIQEMNTVRKHLSAVKGGRLAQAFFPAAVLSLVLSDVVGDDLDAIASGPTVPDSGSWADALAVVRRRALSVAFPAAALRMLEQGVAGGLSDTPKARDPAFLKTRTILIGSNRLALLAAAEKARSLGYEPFVLTSRITGEAREIAQVFRAMAEDALCAGFPVNPPACVIAGGETTVTLRGKGRGGRNQEMALAFLAAMARSRADHKRMHFFSGGTDGNDGPTDAAGAHASWTLLERARNAGLDPEAYLADNDSYAFFDAIGGLVRTGPTGTNVCDIQVLLVGPEGESS